MPSGADPSGLYENSDAESLSDELSPTDGYFNSRQNNTPNILVHDPSQNMDKAAEAQEEREGRHTSESHSTHRRQSYHVPQSSIFSRRYDPEFEGEESHTEHTPLIPQSAPPTYSAATNGSSERPSVANDATGTPGVARDYSTIETVENLLNGQSDASGRHTYPETMETESSRKPIHWYRRASARSITLVVISFAALAVAIALITEAVTHVGEEHESRKNPAAPSLSCPGGIYTNNKTFTFNRTANFWFVELIHPTIHATDRRYSQVRTFGDIHIRPAILPSEESFHVKIASHSSDEDLIKMLRWDQTAESLLFTTPDKIATDPTSSLEPCIYLNVTIWVNLGTYLANFSIDTVTMTTTFHDALSFTAYDTLAVSASNGDILMPSPSKLANVSLMYGSLLIQTSKGSVGGMCSLSRKIDISSRVGNIDISIELQGSLEAPSKSAILSLESSDGNIKADTSALNITSGPISTSNIPDRIYQTTVNTVNGNIWLNLIHGKDTSIGSSSGSVQARLVPYGTITGYSKLKTLTTHGDVHLTLTPSILHDESPIKNLQSYHKSILGWLDVTYPLEWEGILSGDIASSSLQLNWSDLRIAQDSKAGGIFRKLKAFKGKGKSSCKIVSTSGAVTLRDGSTF